MPGFDIKNFFIPASSPCALDTFKRGARNILVVAPHPDDDVIGAGGTMRMLADKGCNVFSLYITDGSSPIFKNKNINLLRQQEALSALKIVRARGGIFLNHKSSRVKRAEPAPVIEEIKKVVCFFMPEEIYLPSPFERHATHVCATRLAVTALRHIKGYYPKLRGYAVWGGIYGLPGSCAADITKVIHIKKKAIRMHKSQLAAKAYDSGMLGRNHYEGAFMETHSSGGFKYAETFLDMGELLVNRKSSLQSFAKKTADEFLAGIFKPCC